MRPTARPFGDGAMVAGAVVVTAAAWIALAVPLWLVLTVGGVALVWRHPLVVIGALALAGSCLADRAWSGMHPPSDRAVTGVATLVDDPVTSNGAVHAEMKIGGHHFDAWARGPNAGVLARRLAGERVDLAASVSAGAVPGWLGARHVVARLQIERIIPVDDGNLVARTANSLRRVLVRGARSLGDERRALFTGLVIGDDRAQPIEVTDDFLGAGLSHLLAVSGQNVAFVLAAAAPLLRPLGLRSRLLATIAVLLLFATVTRFEPSVLRATVMTGFASVAASIGRSGPNVRLLALAVTALVLIDPFLVHSVGFGLSVSASAGILWLSRPVGDVLPGPRWLRDPVAVVLAAQLGVAPLLLVVFGGVPVASLPANLVAEPVAGMVMIWGTSAGLVAGLVPEVIARLIHGPTALGLWWIASVARWWADARLGELGAPGILAGVLFGLAAGRARARHRLWARCFLVALVVVLLVPAIRLRSAPAEQEVVGAGTVRRTSGGTVLELALEARPATALRALRAHGVAHLDVVQLPSDGAAAQAVANVIARRIAVERVDRPTTTSPD